MRKISTMLTKIHRCWPYQVPRLVFEFFRGSSDFDLNKNIFFTVNAKITPIAAVIR
jgi:hypothetical protein